MGPFGKKKPIEEMNAKEVEKEAKKLSDKKNWDEAEVYLRRLIELRPDYTPAYSALATCLTYTDRRDEALEQFETALKIKPDDSTLLVSRGLLLATMDGRMIEAIEFIEQGVAHGYKSQQVDTILQNLKRRAWSGLPPTTGDHILVINRTIDPEALKPIEDPTLKEQGLLKEGQVAIDIEPTLDFIGEIAKEAMAAGKVVSMRDLCQKGGIISNQKGKDVVGIAGQKHGFTTTYQLLSNDDLLATFEPK
ncbi:MAG: tetratricopeptide repeat protein [Candidatus Thorarchaeota archaeon]